jgi:hypothetical protein
MALFSGTGFDDDLVAAASARSDVMLVGPDRMDA